MSNIIDQMKKVTVAWAPKNKATAGRTRVLEYRHLDGSKEIVPPNVVGDKVLYNVTEEYARELLGNCGHQFKLVEPAKMLVPFTDPKNGAREYREVFSMTSRKGFGGSENPESAPVLTTASTDPVTTDAKAKVETAPQGKPGAQKEPGPPPPPVNG